MASSTLVFKKSLCAGAALILLGCGASSDEGAVPAPEAPSAAQIASAEASNMRLVSHHDLQGRSAYQPVVHAYGDRRILFVGHHIGESVNPLTGNVEQNGTSILDVTDPRAPQMLRHLPPNGEGISAAQHAQICDGTALPNGDPNKVYMVRTNGLVSYELYDVTDPASPEFILTIDETGDSSRPESSRGNRETHKIQWECGSGIGYFNGTPEGWRVTRALQAYDLGTPEEPRHIRDFGLLGYQPDAEGPFPEYLVSGLHQPFALGNRIYLGYGSGNDGTLQILDRDKFLNGDPESDDPFAPTPENLLYPEIARLDMPSYWGVHTAKPLLNFPIADYQDDQDHSSRDFLMVVSEAQGQRCDSARDITFMVDITEEDKPFPVSSFQTPAEPGGFCQRGSRFGPHSMQDEFHPGFDHSLAIMSYFNGGIRAFDIRDPFDPVEVAHFVPEITENTTEACSEMDGVQQCVQVIQTNNVNIDDRGYIYGVDRSNTGLHIVELTGPAREIAGLE